jgi:succinate dehydrogenase iron-sulfur subunit
VRITLRVWRQADAGAEGGFARYDLDGVSPEATLLEALDLVNDRLAARGEPPVAFDSDCREAICGACGLCVNGRPHGGSGGGTTCQLTLREFEDGAVITLEPFRTGVFRVVRDLVVDRGALDRVVRAGGYVSVRVGSAPEAGALPIEREAVERALDAATCIGCGACVAACPNGSAALFVGAKIAHLARLPQGQPERARRAHGMAAAADGEGFGACAWHGECEAACPKGIDLGVIAGMNREYLVATIGEWWSAPRRRGRAVKPA